MKHYLNRDYIKANFSIIVLLTTFLVVLILRSIFFLGEANLYLSEEVTDETAYNYVKSDENRLYTTNVETTEVFVQEIKERLEASVDYIYSVSENKYYDIDAFNKLSQEELMTLSGIGEVTAKAIISFRESEGPFKTFDELTNVKGIGEKKIAKLVIKRTK